MTRGCIPLPKIAQGHDRASTQSLDSRDGTASVDQRILSPRLRPTGSQGSAAVIPMQDTAGHTQNMPDVFNVGARWCRHDNP